MSDGKFVTTRDKETSEKLEEKGMTLVNYANGVWTFINDKKFSFDKEDKLRFTNKLCF